MNEKDFLQQLQNYNKDDIPQATIAKIQSQFLDDPEFKPARVAKASNAAKGLCDWIIKMKQYDTINRFIKPKRVELQNAQDRYKARI